MRAPILWITPWWPYPPTDGARMASRALLRGLSLQGEEIVLAALSPVGINPREVEDLERDYGVKQVSVIHLPNKLSFATLRNLARLRGGRLAPLTYARFFDQGLVNMLKTIIESNSWNAVVGEGLHTAALLRPLIKSGTPFFYRAQNCESELWKQRSDSAKGRPIFSFVMRKLFAKEAEAVRVLEMETCATADTVLTISNTDAEVLSPWCKVPPVVIPVGLRFTPPPLFKTNIPLSILFVGKLDWAPNRDGLEWFLQEIWPVVISNRDDIQLTVIGSGNNKWLRGYTSLKNINYIHHLKDIGPAYADSHLGLVPVRFGSGIRVKSIEAARFGRACLTTSIGNMGLPLLHNQSALVADTAEEWCSTLGSIDLAKLEVLGAEAWSTLKDYCSEERTAKLCVSTIKLFNTPRTSTSKAE